MSQINSMRSEVFKKTCGHKVEPKGFRGYLYRFWIRINSTIPHRCNKCFQIVNE